MTNCLPIKTIPQISFKEKDDNSISGFELLDFGELLSRNWKNADHDPFLPHRLNFFAIIAIRSGTVDHSLDFNSYALSGGDNLVVSKGQVHAFDKKSPYQGHMILFTEEFLLGHLAPSAVSKISRLYNYHLRPVRHHRFDGSGELIALLEKEIQSGNPALSSEIIAAILSIYLLKLETGSAIHDNDQVSGRSYEIFDAFRNQLESGFRQTRDAKDYAKKLAVSYKRLNSVCKELTGKTAKRFIDDYVILESKRQLSATALSVKEISYDCGFDEPTNFLKYFRKHTGQTPVQFRNKYR